MSLQTTGIGSLPHHNIDAAIEFAFQFQIPFFPQIPIRNPQEFMLAQALEGLPGLDVQPDGAVSINLDLWNHRAFDFQQKLSRAFEVSNHEMRAFESYEPSSIAAACWTPFLWELEERKVKRAKAQIAGPITCQWALRNQTGAPIDADVANQVYQLVLARAIAMVRAIRERGVRPVFFFDEPGLYALNMPGRNAPGSDEATHSNGQTGAHWAAFQQLRLALQTVRKEGALVGVHCCSNTDWHALLGLPLDYLSLDTDLSWADVAKNHPSEVRAFVQSGGRFAFGVLPTQAHRPVDPTQRVLELWSSLTRIWENDPKIRAQVIQESLYTPACGLALSSIDEAQAIQTGLAEIAELTSRTKADRTELQL